MSAPLDLDGRINEAAQLMQGRSAGQAVCALTKSGMSVPGVKYAEGRWAALREVQRAVRAGGELANVAQSAEQSWVEQLRALQGRGAGQDWIAYRSGGIDALTELNAEIGADSASRRAQP